MCTVIFDLDGTLADTSRDMIDAANRCFQRLGLGVLLTADKDGAMAMLGGGRAMLRLGFSRTASVPCDDDIEEYYPMLLESYAENIDQHTQLYPDVAQAIEGILTAGYATGVCTNKPQDLAETLLQCLGIRSLFSSVVGSKRLLAQKPDPAPLIEAITLAGGDLRKSVLVGDSPTDRETARAAKLPCLLVTFGPEGQNVARLLPEGLLHRYLDLESAVDQLIS